MTKILLAFPNWDNRWIPYFKTELSVYDVRGMSTDKLNINTLWQESLKADVLINMWADEVTKFWTHYLPNKCIISYLRRYERYNEQWRNEIKWENVDALVFVSEAIEESFLKVVKEKRPKRVYCIPNAVDLEQFPFIEKDNEPTDIAFVASGASHKNLPMAAQILMLLPDKYVVHHIGNIPSFDREIWQDYLHGLGMSRRWVWHPKIPAYRMPEWLADKDFILSTSITEGNPNNVIEAMAMGLKPIVHNWPGAKDQFGKEHVFNTVEEAVDMIQNGDYIPGKYRAMVEKKYSLANIKKIHDVIKEVMSAD